MSRLPGLLSFLGAAALVTLSAVGCSDDKSSGGGGRSGSNGEPVGGAPDMGDGGKPGGGSSMVPGLDDLGEQPAPEAAWTVLIYGHGDHNLSNSLLTDLQEMARAKAGAAGQLNVLALTDWDASQAIAGSDPPQAFPEGIQL